MFLGNNEQEYRNMYSEVLPDDWLEVVRPQLAMASLGDRHIVYPEKPVRAQLTKLFTIIDRLYGTYPFLKNLILCLTDYMAFTHSSKILY